MKRRLPAAVQILQDAPKVQAGWILDAERTRKIAPELTLPLLHCPFFRQAAAVEVQAPILAMCDILGTQEVPILAIWLQNGTAATYFLADPADPEVSSALDAWRANKAIAIMTMVGEEEIASSFNLEVPAAAIRARTKEGNGSASTERFLKLAAQMLLGQEFVVAHFANRTGLSASCVASGCVVATDAIWKIREHVYRGNLEEGVEWWILLASLSGRKDARHLKDMSKPEGLAIEAAASKV